MIRIQRWLYIEWNYSKPCPISDPGISNTCPFRFLSLCRLWHSWARLNISCTVREKAKVVDTGIKGESRQKLLGMVIEEFRYRYVVGRGGRHTFLK